MTSTLVLLRHGQSEWNKLGLFTGWKDVPLSAQGVEEARAAGQLMLDADLKPLVLHTSLLKRAISTANLALETMDRQWLPVHRHWRLNERHYGSLQGLDKKETSAKHGKEQVFSLRRSYNVRPPALAQDDEMHPRNDPRYAKLSVDVLPSSECLADVVARMLPYFFDSVVPDLRENKTPLIVAHGNSLRALIKYLDGVSDEAITSLNIPTGIPLVYTLDHNLRCTKSRYLGDADAAKKAAEAVAHQAV